MTAQSATAHFRGLDRLTRANEQTADIALAAMWGLRDSLVERNERVAAELVESAMQSLQDACKHLTRGNNDD